jgi:NAD(P)-dependent dehydrogenase (short-subunit alcohol dehydrogenase family)
LPPASRTALITGAAKRIGRALALGLAGAGWNVCVHYHRSEQEAADLVVELVDKGVRAAAIGADLNDLGQLEGLTRQCAYLLGAPTCLINNASLFNYDVATDFTAASWARHIDVNLRAPVMLSRDFARWLPAAQEGCVINLLDQKIFNLNPDFFSYTMAKIGLEGATRLLAVALAPRVRVCAIAPGLTLPSADQSVENFAAAHTVTPLGRAGNVDDIVASALYILNTPSLTGQTLCVDGGQRFLPLDRDVMFKVPKP